MFYRIKNNSVSDYADYEYADDCLYTDLCTMSYFDKHRDDYIVENNQIKINPDLNTITAGKREEQFKKEFFKTTLGWIRRKVQMQDGSIKDFLSDLLLSIKAGIELGQEVKIITYKTPDYTQEATQEYMLSLQEVKTATMDFVRECLYQTVQDFSGTDENVGGNYGI